MLARAAARRARAASGCGLHERERRESLPLAAGMRRGRYVGGQEEGNESCDSHNTPALRELSVFAYKMQYLVCTIYRMLNTDHTAKCRCSPLCGVRALSHVQVAAARCRCRRCCRRVPRVQAAAGGTLRLHVLQHLDRKLTYPNRQDSHWPNLIIAKFRAKFAAGDTPLTARCIKL